MAQQLEVVLDTCEYPENQAPDARLGRIWAQQKIPDAQRVALARNIRTITQMANLASNSTILEARIKTLLTSGNHWPDDEAEQIILTMSWVAVWKDATYMVTTTTEQETEARKDPHKIHEIADLDLAAMWENFRAAPRGRSILLNEYTSPHKIFLAQMKRDYAVHHILQQYPLKRIFLEKDPVDTVPHWAKSMDNMLKMGGHVEPVRRIDSLEEVDCRMQALWIAADLCGICSFTYEEGPVRLLHMIKDRRESAADKYAFTVRIDAVLRKAIYQKNYQERSKYPTCAKAILAVIGKDESASEADRLIERTLHEIVRQGADNLVETTLQNITSDASLRQAITPDSKRPRAQTPPGPGTGTSKSAQKKARQRASRTRAATAQKAEISRLQAALKNHGKTQPTPGGGGPPAKKVKVETGSPKTRQKMPESEFRALREIKATEKNGKRACRFWNSSIGCSAPEGQCQFAHNLCILCGQNHKWIDHHSGGR